jgi:ribosomal protein S19E (S16A)
LGKKHIRLLELLSRGSIDGVASLQLRHVTRALRLYGLVNADDYGAELTPFGKEFVRTYADVIINQASLETGALAEAILCNPREKKQKVTIKERRFLLFVAPEPRDLSAIRNAKQIIPSVEAKGLIQMDEKTVAITDEGRMALGSEFAAEEVTSAAEYFLAAGRSEPGVVCSKGQRPFYLCIGRAAPIRR